MNNASVGQNKIYYRYSEIKHGFHCQLERFLQQEIRFMKRGICPIVEYTFNPRLLKCFKDVVVTMLIFWGYVT